ncbi:MAG: DUF2520 domain-containing protein [Acidobacteriota bacterium]|nr:DUF2520 domain-containing protein [Acidobacteriota bacterium]MDH3786417.1 DUF2520 domain-containing protein [Acidobacteriota bacterium]
MPPSRPSITLVGAGKLARAILPGLQDADYTVDAVVSTDGSSARRLVASFPGPRVIAIDDVVSHGSSLVLLAVPDRCIVEVARRLANDDEPWSGRSVMHHAGALDLSPLEALQAHGASVGLLHPLQSLGHDAAQLNSLRGSWARVDGCDAGLAVASRLCTDIGLHRLPLTSLSDSERARYHAAAALASNDVIGLLGLATEILAGLGIDRRTAGSAITRLAAGTTSQADHGGLASALTGPVVRGDAEVVARHLDALSEIGNDPFTIHTRLSRQLLALAIDSDEASRERLAKIARILDDAG